MPGEMTYTTSDPFKAAQHFVGVVSALCNSGGETFPVTRTAYRSDVQLDGRPTFLHVNEGDERGLVGDPVIVDSAASITVHGSELTLDTRRQRFIGALPFVSTSHRSTLFVEDGTPKIRTDGPNATTRDAAAHEVLSITNKLQAAAKEAQ